jgi:hypothetical protein
MLFKCANRIIRARLACFDDYLGNGELFYN